MEKMRPVPSPLLSLAGLPLLIVGALAAAPNLPAPSTRPAPSTVNSAASTIPTLKPIILARYPHDTNAFSQGLQYLGKNTYIESTGDGPGISQSGVRLSDLKTARVHKQIRTPLEGAFGEGVTVLGRTAYHLTWKDGAAFALDAETLQEFRRFNYQGEGWGITQDGKQLIMSNGSPVVVWRDPNTFAVIRSITVTANGQAVKNLNELEYVQGSLYANVWLTDRIARIDPQTGKVTAWIDVSGLSREASAAADRRGQPFTFDDVANGIAFVPERGTLLLTGKRWPILFEVRLPGVKPESKAGTVKKPGS